MPAELDVDKEAVRVLVVAVGAREAARQMGLNEKTVLHWCHTGNWLAHTRPQPKPVLPLSMQKGSGGSVKPADALSNILADRHRRTKLAQSKYVAEASEDLASVTDKLAVTDAGLQLANMAAKVWPEQSDGPMRLSIFANQAAVVVEQVGVEHDVIDVEQA